MEARGFASAWLVNIFEFDAIRTSAIIGRETQRIEVGTAVVPTIPRHPVAMAQQALTAQAAARQRSMLGIGLSHRLMMEDMFRLSWHKPARHLWEYLAMLIPLLNRFPRRPALGAGRAWSSRPEVVGINSPTRSAAYCRQACVDGTPDSEAT
jgi:alkanesulfonate monooxygenase SsuD/methylene tetrahydromethanopterin reductase-like flavin-dependent oxidoreductase (luciferase family)